VITALRLVGTVIGRVVLLLFAYAASTAGAAAFVVAAIGFFTAHRSAALLLRDFQLDWSISAVFALLPWLVAVIYAERFGIRRYSFYAFSGFLAAVVIAGAVHSATAAVTFTRWAALLAAAIVGASIHWVVAGWSAGSWGATRREPVSPRDGPAGLA